MTVKIHHEGTPVLITLFVIFAIILVPLWIWVHPMAIAIGATLVLGVVYLLAVNFFRSPHRHFRGNHKGAVVASADGRVVACEKVYEPEYLKREVMQVSVFMSILNVHANWYPVDGEVLVAKHHAGRFMAAYLPKSSVENERSTVVIRTPDGTEVLVRQVAGAMARRIVTYAQPGAEASIDDHMGFIKFGSRVDIYIPLDSEVFVKIGDRTVGGITQIAQLPAK
ncbi:MAG: phosphatidylserine decarboxylase family protein [Muribaculaceae bacterium]|nr:phosphatidylserine decarboxylase family protein [Muribaculaceae bacterium]MDE6320748.1 phosphatidylserine decarboxylase family protein [Muribaculaceae bacterium]